MLSDLGSLNHKRCKNPYETLVVLLEVERKVQEIREITGNRPSDERLVSILLAIMDYGTKTNVSGTMTTDTTFPTLRNKIRAHATLLGGIQVKKAQPP